MPDAKAAIMAAVLLWVDDDAPFGLAFAFEEVPGLAVGVGGFQCRNAVQILHGFPSGPRTIPGGSGAFLEDELDVSADI